MYHQEHKELFLSVCANSAPSSASTTSPPSITNSSPFSPSSTSSSSASTASSTTSAPSLGYPAYNSGHHLTGFHDPTSGLNAYGMGNLNTLSQLSSLTYHHPLLQNANVLPYGNGLSSYYSPYYYSANLAQASPYAAVSSILPHHHHHHLPHLAHQTYSALSTLSEPQPLISIPPAQVQIQVQIQAPVIMAPPVMAPINAFTQIPLKPHLYNQPPKPESRTQVHVKGRGRGRPSKRTSPVSSAASSYSNEESGTAKVKRKRETDNPPKKKSRFDIPPKVEPIDDEEGHLIIKYGMELTSQYKIISLLGEGTFGKVVMCQERTTGKKVAIKIIKSIQKYRDAAMCEISVFDAIKKNDPKCDKGVIHLMRWFEHRSHICMVFELLGQSVFDFLKDNLYYPFPLTQIHEFTRQILSSVSFLHSLKLIHTDLKPENILLVSSEFKVVPFQNSPSKTNRSLLSTELKVIDFGSTIFENDYHSSVVCTRHYRAPEIILGLGWSFPCDLWSIGCILLELYTGEALFQTHENLEHLAMMERILGKMPREMTESETGKKFYERGSLKFPDKMTTPKSEKRVEKLKSFLELAKNGDKKTKSFFDLISRLLVYEPARRITANEALRHEFVCTDWN